MENNMNIKESLETVKVQGEIKTDNILEVKNLKVSFRTTNGIVKAVRDISFNLQRGETIAIVGESGSGKSVTSKAILGISAANAIIESGEIFYDGKDLLKIEEEDFHQIRGDKISMIFQDPLSSLDPIVKVGKQLTEAMILKNKANRRRSRKEFNSRLEILKKYFNLYMAENGGDTKATEEANAAQIKEFDNFNICAIKYENSFNEAYAKAVECNSDIADILFKAEKKQNLSERDVASKIIESLKEVKDRFLTFDCDEKIQAHIAALTAIKNATRKDTFVGKIKGVFGKESEGKQLSETLVNELHEVKKTLEDLESRKKPDYFTLGYYLLKNPDAQPDPSDIDALDKMTREYIDQNFMIDFLDKTAKALRYIYNFNIEHKKKVLELLESARDVFGKNEWNKKECKEYIAKVAEEIAKAINPLAVRKDSVSYTFKVSMNNSVKRYFEGIVKNPKEQARFDKQTAKRNAAIAKGKSVDYKVMPMMLIDLDQERINVENTVKRLRMKYEQDVAAEEPDFDKLAVELVDDFKDKASRVVSVVTKKMAREKAIKLMEEVGIPEPRIRFYQYPFEFSGGMRQRIVIAIALAANPDILICDEPTTALDVTIQAQILELINKLKRERNLSVIFITHDLGVVANMADRIAVMYAGKIVEYGTSEDVFYDPRHPYTWALLSSMPDLDTKEKLEAIPGTPPNMIYPPKGDAFAARNKYAMKIDFEEQPPMFKISDTHYAATWLLHPDAPKVDPPKLVTDRINRMKREVNNNG